MILTAMRIPRSSWFFMLEKLSVIQSKAQEYWITKEEPKKPAPKY